MCGLAFGRRILLVALARVLILVQPACTVAEIVIAVELVVGIVRSVVGACTTPPNSTEIVEISGEIYANSGWLCGACGVTRGTCRALGLSFVCQCRVAAVAVVKIRASGPLLLTLGRRLAGHQG